MPSGVTEMFGGHHDIRQAEMIELGPYVGRDPATGSPLPVEDTKRD